MGIKLEKLMEKMELSEDQLKLMSEAQENLDQQYNIDIETQKAGVINKNNELIDKLKAAKENELPENFDIEGYNEYTQNREQILADQKKLDDDKLIATENWDKLKNDMNNSHESSIKKMKRENDSVINGLRSALDSELIENVALKEIEKVQGSHVLLMPHIKNNIQTFQDAQGKYQTKVVDEVGQDRINTETGEPMSVEELVSEFQANDLFSGAFPLQNRGSNTTIVVDGANYNSTNNPFDKKGNNYSLTEQSKLNKSNPVLAKTLREAAN